MKPLFYPTGMYNSKPTKVQLVLVSYIIEYFMYKQYKVVYT